MFLCDARRPGRFARLNAVSVIVIVISAVALSAGPAGCTRGTTGSVLGGTATVASGASPPKAAHIPSPVGQTMFVGRYYLHRPPNGDLFKMTWMFQDTSCHHYSLKLGPRFKKLDTAGVLVVTGTASGSTLTVEASADADAATSAHARKTLSKCSIPEGAIFQQ